MGEVCSPLLKLPNKPRAFLGPFFTGWASPLANEEVTLLHVLVKKEGWLEKSRRRPYRMGNPSNNLWSKVTVPSFRASVMPLKAPERLPKGGV
jgi:hypothetical protein